MLYIYSNIEQKKRLKKFFNEYKSVGASFFIGDDDNIFNIKKWIIDESINYIMFDISNLIHDSRHLKLYVEQLLWIVQNYIENIQFCIHQKYFVDFIDDFSDFFDESEISYEYNDNDEIGDKNAKIKISSYVHPDKIIIYDSLEMAKNELDGTLITISEIIENFDGSLLIYNIAEIKKKIKTENIKYLDITSLIEVIEIRRDLILQIELMLIKLVSICEVKFCIQKNFETLVREKMPGLFETTIEIFKDIVIQEDKEQKDTISYDAKELLEKVDAINLSLIGHDTFKQDFKNKVVEYSILNKLGEQKIFSILLSGDSGIGKTEFAKIVSQNLFPNEELIKINFGNYSTEGVLNSLIGSPLGYIGSDEGGELINKIQRSGSKVILVDEFEKATPSVYNFFYELLEDGVFTDRHGEKHNLNGYIIIFTSNMTQKEYQKHIPNSLKSRFDMIYYFVDISVMEKKKFIEKEAKRIMEKLKNQFQVSINYEDIRQNIENLIEYRNLREIKRKVDDIVILEYIKNISYKTK